MTLQDEVNFNSTSVGRGIFLQSAIKRLSYYKELGDKTFEQLDEPDFHFMPAQECNSIAMIIQHMHGNMMSRWTDFLTSDGEKEWRTRDAEFEQQNMSKYDLILLWNKGWSCFMNSLHSLTENDLTKTIYIRSEPLTVINAINRQLAHYPYHVGQIIYAAKIIKNKKWENLSISKGRSAAFNNEMKNQP